MQPRGALTDKTNEQYDPPQGKAQKNTVKQTLELDLVPPVTHA